MDGIFVRPTIGIGDAVEFSSTPENYFRHTGKKLIDTANHWIFDFNPYVVREGTPGKVFEMWNGYGKATWPMRTTMLSNAELGCCIANVPMVVNRPRLYRYEEFPFEFRKMILIQTNGVSHGMMPKHIIEHIEKKYEAYGDVFELLGPKDVPLTKFPKIFPKDLWQMAKVISECRMIIGMDSGPTWIAACYPDVIIKKIRVKPTLDVLKDWIPLEIKNIHSHWDDRCAQIFNVSEDDVGFTWSYKRI